MNNDNCVLLSKVVQEMTPAETGTNSAFLKQTLIFGLWVSISRTKFPSNMNFSQIELDHGEE